MSQRIALITNSPNGGLWSGTRFIAEAIHRSGRYECDIVLLATSRRDAASVRLFSPVTWIKGPQITLETLDGVSYYHAGAILCELEFQRYKPRSVLTQLLDRYDLIQLYTGSPAWAMVTQKLKCPVVLKATTLAATERVSVLEKRRGAYRLWSRVMTKLTAALDYKAMCAVDVLMVDNKWMYDVVSHTIGPNKTVFAPSGIDVDFWGGSDYRFDGYILSVSRLSDPRKNVRLLLEAYAALRESKANMPKLVLAGRGGLLPDDWNYAVSRGIADHLEVHADVTAEQLRALYHNAAIFVLSSNEEGLGIVLLEAMACCLPVISTDCGGPSVIVIPHKTGLLTPVGDVHSLASAISSLLDNPELRRQMGQNGRERVSKHFSFASVGKVYIDLYDRLLGTK